MRSDKEKREQMLNAPVELLVCKMAVPTIISMLISAFYNMADTYFVGKLDTLSTASVGLALPIMTVIQAIGFFFGHGSGNYMSRKLGEGDTKASSQMSDTSVILSFICGAVLMLLGFIFIKPLAVLLGATPKLMDTSVEYMSILIIGTPFIMTSFTLNNQIRFRGNATLGMIGMAAGSVLNVVLDPIFIFVLDMGLKGAAYATVLSQIVSFVTLFAMSGRIPFKKPNFGVNKEIVSAILTYGTPSIFRQGIMSVATICLNNSAGIYGENVIAAISVVSKIVFVGNAVVIGFGQGFQPVCGFNNGAKRYDRVYKLFSFCIKASTAFMLVFGALSFAFASSLVAFFRDDAEVINAGIPLLRFQSATAVLMGVITMTNMLLQNMGKTFSASVLAVARQGLFFIPLVYILPHFFGVYGIYAAQSGADFLTVLVTIPMTVSAMKTLKRNVREKAAA